MHFRLRSRRLCWLKTNAESKIQKPFKKGNFGQTLTTQNTHLHNHIDNLQIMVVNWVEEDPEEDPEEEPEEQPMEDEAIGDR